MEFQHVSVMVKEVLEALSPSQGKTMVDATLGGNGGHARAILERISPDGLLIGIDQDPEAVANVQSLLSGFASCLQVFHDSFSRLPRVLEKAGISGVDGILADIGVSSDQLLRAGRGFGFMADEPLDMRMNPQGPGLTAADIVNTWDEKELAALFFQLGEERFSRRIAKRIVERVKESPIGTSRELAQLVETSIPGKARKTARIHPATRVFQALRIRVNEELKQLETLLEVFPGLLLPGGRICIISFHSLEDRLVKRRFRSLARPCTCPPGLPVCACGKKPVGRVLYSKGVKASEAEVAANPMARSARLRAFEMF